MIIKMLSGYLYNNTYSGINGMLLTLVKLIHRVCYSKKNIVCLFIVIVLLNIGNNANGQYQYFSHKGMNRKYILHLPANLPPNAPLVFVLHGYTGTALDIIKYSGMDAVADSNLFAVCYPEGTKDKDSLNCWNLGYDMQKGMQADDLDFLESLAVYVQATYHLSPQNTFCAGHSNGGDMCYLIACHGNGIFKAVAPVSGCLMKWIKDSGIKTKPVPVFEIHGTDDSTTYWNGDLNNRQGYGPYYDITSTFKLLAARNKCKTEAIDTIPHKNSVDGSIVIRDKFTNGITNTQVWLYTILHGGHGWSVPTENNMDINYSAEIWMFFKQFLKKQKQ